MGRCISNDALMTQDECARILYERGVIPVCDRRSVQFSEARAFRKIKEADPDLFRDYLEARGRVPALPRGIVRIW